MRSVRADIARAWESDLVAANVEDRKERELRLPVFGDAVGRGGAVGVRAGRGITGNRPHMAEVEAVERRGREDLGRCGVRQGRGGEGYVDEE